MKHTLGLVLTFWLVASPLSSMAGDLIWTDVAGPPDDHRLCRMDLSSGTVITLADDLAHPRGIALDELAEVVYWGDLGTETVKRNSYAQSGLASEFVMPASPEFPGQIAIDPTSRALFWADQDGIWRYDLDDQTIEQILDAPQNHPVGITVDPLRRFIYWTDIESNTIQRCNYDGSNLVLIQEDIDECWSIAVDPINGKVYFPSITLGSVFECGVDGEDVRVIATGIQTPTTVLLDYSSDKLYWTDGLSGQVNRITRANLDGSDLEDVFWGSEFPWGLAITESDFDRDGTRDMHDHFPLDPEEQSDSDGDGIGDNTDLDDDNDGLLDDEEIELGTDPRNPDSDGDSSLDGEDHFPLDETEWRDSDDDGVGDNSDAFPNDPAESRDSDKDGLGDNADPDDDNDDLRDDQELLRGTKRRHALIVTSRRSRKTSLLLRVTLRCPAAAIPSHRQSSRTETASPC